MVRSDQQAIHGDQARKGQMGDRPKIEARRVQMAERARTATPERPLLAAIRCSFCSAKGSDVEHIFGGSSAFICDRCIDALNAVLMERRSGEGARPGDHRATHL
jgi:hypothetical protein